MSDCGFGYLYGGFNVSQTWLAGMTQPQLAQLYASLIAAKQQMLGGSKVVNASYTQGDGNKSVTYQMTSLAAVDGALMLVMRALGLGGPSRRPMRPVWLR